MSLRRLAIALATGLLAASLMAVGSAPAEPKEDCNWGASSVIAGQGVRNEPVTTGCIPTAP